MAKREEAQHVRVFGIASFLNDLGSDMIYPIWPLFVLSLGADMKVLGLIDGLGDAIVSISQAVSGYLSDKYQSRKPFIWLGYLAGGISRLGYAFTTAWQWLIPFKILDRAGKMRGAPRDAIIADVSTDKDRASNFGFLRMMDNLGAATGILLTIGLLNLLYVDLRTIMLLAAIPSLIGALGIYLLIKDRKTANVFKGIHLKDFSPNFKIFLLLSSIFALASFSYSFLLVLATQAGFMLTTVPVLYLLFTAIAALTSVWFGKQADRYGRRAVLAASFLFFALVCGLCLWQGNLAGIILAFVFYGLHQGAIQPVQRAFVSELVPKGIRSSMLGTFQMVTGLCALPASVIAGILWQTYGSWATFGFSLSLTLVATGLMLFVKETI